MNTKLCPDCREARRFSTGSTIFYICNVTKQYRSVSDYCNLDEAVEK